MPTVVDSLIIQLGLDPSNFTKGQKDAAAAFAKTKQQMKKDAEDVESAAKNMRDALGKATAGVFDLMAALLGGRGIKEFVQDATKANTALGNFSSGLGTSAQWAAAWGVAAQRMGGSAAATMGSIQSLSDALVDLHTQGKSLPDALFLLEAKSGKNIDIQHGWEKTAIDLASAASVLAKTDHATANRLLRAVGIDPATAELMIRQGPRMRSWIEMNKKLTPSPADIAAAERMTDAQGKLRAEYDLLASKVLTALEPALVSLAEKLDTLIEWFDKFVEKHPQIIQAFTGVAAVLTGAGILSAIKNILGLRRAIAALLGANEAFVGGGLLGFLAANPWTAGLIAAGTVLAPTPAEGGDEVQRRKNLASDPDYYKPGHPGGGNGGSSGGSDGGSPASGNEMIRRRAAGGGSARIDKMAQGKNAQAVVGELRKAGYNDNAIAAVLGSMQTESSMNPAVPENSYNHGHHGLWQWDSNRWPRIASWIRSQGGDPYDAAWQARAWVAEHNAKPGDAIYDSRDTAAGGAILRSNPSLGAAVHGVRLSERFGPGEEGGRAANAANWLPHLTAPPSPSASGIAATGDADYQKHRGGKVPIPAMVNPPLWKGSPVSGNTGFRGGAAHAAALNNISNDNRASTTSTSNESHAHIATLNVNAPNATDAHGIARNMREAMIANDIFGNFAPA